MFEMGAAAGASLSLASSGARLLLSQASIAAPCQLSVRELKCHVSLRYPAIQSMLSNDPTFPFLFGPHQVHVQKRCSTSHHRLCLLMLLPCLAAMACWTSGAAPHT